jgi:hypothetical protein
MLVHEECRPAVMAIRLLSSVATYLNVLGNHAIYFCVLAEDPDPDCPVEGMLKS